MIGAIVPKFLQKDDVLYRGLSPEAIDEIGTVKREGFLDNYESLSLFVSGYASPSASLTAISNRKSVKIFCGTGKTPPTPLQMYQAGFRVAAIAGSDIIRAIEKSNGKMWIIPKFGDQIDNRGHMDLKGGKSECDTWARLCRILSENEIFEM